jgi:dTDP-4-amino-4,6-dideoxygalactose transaminase
MRTTFLPVFKPAIDEGECREVGEVLKSGWLTAGPKTEKFEKEFSKKVDAEYAVGVLNGTVALHLSLLAAGVKPGSEVITTPLTFCATANAIEHVNGKPIFVDVERSTGNIDPAKIKEEITKKTSAVIPVHYRGAPCEMDDILKIAKERNIKIIEDAAHCADAAYKNREIGSISDFTCFSFYANKNITMGEGGLITTNDRGAYELLLSLRLHGLTSGAADRYGAKKFRHSYVIYAGYNFTMFDIIAAIGIKQLQKIRTLQRKRKRIWQAYDKAFRNLDGIFLLEKGENTTKHGLHIYTIHVETEKLTINRDEFVTQLRKMNIGTGIHYNAVHLEPYYQKKYGFKKGDFPNAEYIAERTISLPIFPDMEDHDVEDVIYSVKYILRNSRTH